MKHNILFSFSCILFFTFCGCKEKKQYKSYPEVEKFVNSFFNKYELKKGIGAIDFLFPNNNSSEIKNLKEKLSLFENKAGNYVDKELIVQKTIGKGLLMYSYMVKYSKMPLHVTLIFYKAKDQWSFHQFNFDNNLEEELEESGRLYYLINQFENKIN